MNMNRLTASWSGALRRGLRGSALSACTTVAALWLTGCASSDPNPAMRHRFPDEMGGPSTDQQRMYSSMLLPGDQIVITFSDMDRPPQQQLLNVPETGVITLPFDVHVQAIGKSTTQLEKDIRDAYVPSIFVKLTATVKQERRAFFVDGEVKTPGRQEYFGQMTVLRAIGTAGGFSDFANRKKIEVRRASQRFIVNWYKALDHWEEDIPIFPGDHIIVKRSIGLW